MGNDRAPGGVSQSDRDSLAPTLLLLLLPLATVRTSLLNSSTPTATTPIAATTATPAAATTAATKAPTPATTPIYYLHHLHFRPQYHPRYHLHHSCHPCPCCCSTSH
ncbi:unnamed protein product [Closterium sp. NIES-54]